MNNKDHTDFYIGYLPKAPGSYRNVLLGAILSLALVVALVSGILSTNQKQFTDNVFEFDKLTTVEGVLITYPVPMLMIGPAGNPKGVLLVGFGKCGAEATIEAIENTQKTVLSGKRVKMQGTLIYGEGKTVMELTEGEESLIQVLQDAEVPDHLPVGNTQIVGKIIDPKCYFGVMKPGEGKTHRACAIRCIAGGIPPVLRTLQGEFVLLTHPTTNLNAVISPYVDDYIHFEGDLQELADWQIVQLDIASIKLGIPYVD